MSDLYKGTMPKLRTGKPLYRISTGYLGAEKPPKLGELSDAEIVEFYRFQARDGFGRQAIEELSRTEKRPVSEILRILHEHGTALKYKLEDIEAMSKFSQQTKERFRGTARLAAVHKRDSRGRGDNRGGSFRRERRACKLQFRRH